MAMRRRINNISLRCTRCGATQRLKIIAHGKSSIGSSGVARGAQRRMP